MATKKTKLTEAAEKILENSADQFQQNILQKRASAEQFGLGRTDNLPQNAVPTGQSPNTSADPLPEYLIGTPRANYPGIPPKDPQDQFGQGRTDNTTQGQPLQTSVGRTDSAQSSVYTQQQPEDINSIATGVPASYQIPTLATNPFQAQVQTPGQIPLKYNYNEDIEAIFSGENLSEDFKSKANLIFEAAVNTKVEKLVEAQIAEIESKLVEEFNSTIESIKEELEEKNSQYIDYFASEFIKENQIAIEKGLRTEIAEDFMAGLKNLFIEHYIDIPDEKVDIVEELVSRVETLEVSLNEELNKNVSLAKQLSESKKDSIVEEVTEGLTLTQAQKIKNLSKSVDFISEDSFRKNLQTIREAYVPSSKPNTTGYIQSQLNESIVTIEEKNEVKKQIPNEFSAYVRQIQKDLRKK